MNSKVRILVVVIAIFVFCGCAFKLYTINSEYKKGLDEYQALESYVIKSADVQESLAESESEPEDDTDWMGYYEIPELAIDYDGLSAVNPDFLGWFYMPGLEISYPFVQGVDDEFYLHHTFEGEANSNGCLFISNIAKPDFTDYNTFLFGHNMKNGSMFGSLKAYMKDDSTFDNGKSFYIYTKDEARRYDIYSYYVTPPKSDTFVILGNEIGYESYQQMALGKSLRDCGVSVDIERPTVTLSTCSGTGSSKKRFIIHGILVGVAPR